MKICYFADAESIHIVRWCKHFASLGHDVHLISFKNNTIENVTTHFVDGGNINVVGGNWKVLLKFKEIKRLLSQIKPDIFHSHYATSYGITGALCGFHPYIITTLGSDVLISPQKSFIYKLLLKFAFSKADWITAMAEHMKVAINKIGVESTKISVVPFGIDPRIFNDSNRKLNPDRFVITSTRNFEPVYNIPHLINAVAEAKKNIPHIHLNLIGAGSLREELQKLVLEKDLTNNVTFLGKLSQPEIAETLKKSHVFVSVSLSDGNNISLNEAMACGAFCIATNIPANQQWIKNDENGFLIEINDVNTLRDKIVISCQNYNQLVDKANSINKKIIEEKAIWSTNMKKVEEKYHALINEK